MNSTAIAAPTFADELRTAADLIDAHPDLPQPIVSSFGGTVKVTWQLMNVAEAKDDQRTFAQRILRAIGGRWDKSAWGDRFDFEREYHGITLEIFANREQVCERRVVGTETVTVPAVEAQPERTEEREIVEWDCAPVLAEVSA